MKRHTLVLAFVVSTLLSLISGLLLNLAAAYIAPNWANKPWLVYGALIGTFLIALPLSLYLFLQSANVINQQNQEEESVQNEMLHVPNSLWEKYFGKLMENVSKNLPEDRTYQQLKSQRDHSSVSSVVEGFLESTDDQLLILEGLAGSGKSSFVKILARDWAEKNSAAIEAYRESEKFRPPPYHIPLFCSLRGKEYYELQQFIDRLCDELKLWGESRPRHPEKLFEHDDMQWLLFLDGFDEIWKINSRNRFITILDEFMMCFPRVKIILTTRPWMRNLERKFRNAQLVELLPLTDEQIQAYILAHLDIDKERGENLDDVIGQIKAKADLWNLFGYPAYLNAALSVAGIFKEMSDVTQQPDSDLNIPRILRLGQSYVPEQTTQLEERLPSSISEDALRLDQPLEEVSDRLVNVSPPPKEVREVSIPVVVDRIYTVLWDREEDRNWLSAQKSKDWRSKTGLFALKTTYKLQPIHYEKAKKWMGSETALSWVLNMGLLAQEEDTLIRFFTSITQVYFAAVGFITGVKGGEVKFPKQFFSKADLDYRQDVSQFVRVLSTDPIVYQQLEEYGG
ncbi:MAG: NACHT domain-containing protein [Chloroflexi bacterium]|nr:NACHT domain-containing protein [Chloroflexota bacterium]